MKRSLDEFVDGSNRPSTRFVATLEAEERRQASEGPQVWLNQGAERKNDRRRSLDARTIDRSAPNHQIGAHRDFGNERPRTAEL
jgi:hypothetical protein